MSEERTTSDALRFFEARVDEAQRPSWVWLLGLTAVAATLRFLWLGRWSLSGDEIYTHYDALGVDFTDPAGMPWGVRHYPLVYVLTRASYEWLGVSELSARLFPALFGVIAVPAIYWVLSRFSRQAIARWAALLVMLSPWHLLHSQNARFYSAVFLFGGIGSLLFFDALERNRPRALWASLGLVILGTLAHPSGGLVLGALVAYVIVIAVIPGFRRPPGFNRRLLLPPTLVLSIPGLLALPAAQRLIAIRDLSVLREAVYDTTHLISALIFNIGPHLCVMAFVGAVVLLWRRDRLGLFLLITAAIPLLALIGLSFQFSTGHRYAFAVAPAIFTLAAVGIAGMVEVIRQHQPRFAWAVAAVFLLFPLASLISYYQDGNRHDFRAAAQLVAEGFQAGDSVLAESHGYLQHYAPGLYAYELPMGWKRMDEVARRSRRVWCIVKAGRSGVLQDPHHATENWVNRFGRLIERIAARRYDYHLNELRVYLCELPSSD